MPTGDPMWKCKACGKTYFAATTVSCPICANPEYPFRNKPNFDDAFDPLFTGTEEKLPVFTTGLTTAPKTEIGVIVGRFQCSRIHEGYRQLFDFVSARHPRVFVFIGNTPVKGSKRDPLPFQARCAMISGEYPDFEIFKADDVFDLDKWSIALDRQIDLLAGPGQKATLYGSRDCFKYTGKYVVEDYIATSDISSSKIRKHLGVRWQNNEKWREGVIWLSQNRFPVCYPTVDMALVDLKDGMVCLARKPHETLYRFPSGFADIHSDSYEKDALRELEEEFQVKGTNLEYIGSTIVDDPRYRSQEDKIKTLFYAVTAWNGDPTPCDDLKGGEARWFTLESLQAGGDKILVPTHWVLGTMLLNWHAKLLARVQQVKKKI